MVDSAKGLSDDRNAIAHAVALLSHYSFDLGNIAPSQLVEQWRASYPADWIRWAVVEALYQGRYKAFSVVQILELWRRRQQPCCHFTYEFERLVCHNFPRNLSQAMNAHRSRFTIIEPVAETAVESVVEPIVEPVVEAPPVKAPDFTYSAPPTQPDRPTAQFPPVPDRVWDSQPEPYTPAYPSPPNHYPPSTKSAAETVSDSQLPPLPAAWAALAEQIQTTPASPDRDRVMGLRYTLNDPLNDPLDDSSLTPSPSPINDFQTDFLSVNAPQSMSEPVTPLGLTGADLLDQIVEQIATPDTPAHPIATEDSLAARVARLQAGVEWPRALAPVRPEIASNIAKIRARSSLMTWISTNGSAQTAHLSHPHSVEPTPEMAGFGAGSGDACPAEEVRPPIHRFMPLPDASDFHNKLKAVADR